MNLKKGYLIGKKEYKFQRKNIYPEILSLSFFMWGFESQDNRTSQRKFCSTPKILPKRKTIEVDL